MFPHIMKTKFAMLGEYIPNKPLQDLQTSDQEKILSFLYQLGQAMALDVVMNNTDRIPLAHRGEGNPTNILLAEDLSPVFIDNTTSIISTEYRGQYFSVVDEVAFQIYRNSSLKVRHHSAQGGFEGVQRFLKTFFQIELLLDAEIVSNRVAPSLINQTKTSSERSELRKSEKECALIEGFRHAIDTLLETSAVQKHFFHDLKLETVPAFEEADVPVLVTQGLMNIDPEFYEQILSYFRVEQENSRNNA